MGATPTVTVRGEGQVEGPPELATVSAVLHTSGRTAAEVTRSLADLAHQVGAALPDLTFDSVRTDPDDGFGVGMPRAFVMAKGGGPPPELDLEPQPQTVTASVTARFALTDVPRADALPT